MAAANTSLVILAALIEALWVLVVSWGRAGTLVVETILILLLMGAVFSGALFFVLRSPVRLSVPIIIMAAVAFRATAFMCPAPFSTDVYRYRWEGRMTASGENPYELAPQDKAAARFRDHTYASIPAPHARAGYGPLLELLFAAWYRVNPTGGIWWWKLPASAADLAILLMLPLLLPRKDHVIIYAWSPLPVWEFWGNGHNDSIAVALVIGALAFVSKPARSFLLLSLGAAAKLWPILLYPAFMARIPPKWFLISIPVWGLLAAPFWTDFSPAIRSTSGFLGGWRNNDSLFGLIALAFPDPEAAKLVGLAAVLLWSVAVPFFASSLTHATLLICVGTLFISANCHPWYLSWFAPLLALYPNAALVLWTAAMPLSYSVLIDWQALGEWDGSTSIRWWIYIPVFALLAKTLAGTIRRGFDTLVLRFLPLRKPT